MGQQDIYEFLQEHPNEWFTSGEIGDALNLSIDSVSVSLKRLRDTDEVRYQRRQGGVENRKRISISVIAIILGLIFMFYFSNELDKIGTYESINLLYMVASQAVCGAGVVGLIVSLLALKNEEA